MIPARGDQLENPRRADMCGARGRVANDNHLPNKKTRRFATFQCLPPFKSEAIVRPNVTHPSASLLPERGN